MAIYHQEYEWKSFDGVRLYAQSWKPANKPKAVVNLVHGIGEHSTRYAAWADMFAHENIATLSFDHRGHGKSAGRRGDTPSYEAFMKDIDMLLEKSAALFPKLPVILYGHSLGGNLVLNYVLRRKPSIQCVIATSPWLKLTVEPAGFLMTFAKIVEKIIPALQQKTKLATRYLSHDEQVVNQYKSDPLIHDKITVRMYMAMHKAAQYALEHASQFATSLLILHGSDDRITSPQGSKDFALQSANKTTCKIWNGLYHELHNEPEKEEVFKYIIDWIVLNK